MVKPDTADAFRLEGLWPGVPEWSALLKVCSIRVIVRKEWHSRQLFRRCREHL